MQQQGSHLEDSEEAVELSCYLVSFLDSVGRFLESKGTTTACEEFRSWHAIRAPRDTLCLRQRRGGETLNESE